MDWPKPMLPPSHIEIQQRISIAGKQFFHPHPCPCGLKRDGGKAVGFFRIACDIDACANNDVIHQPVHPHFAFQQNSGALTTIDQYIIRPFQLQGNIWRQKSSNRLTYGQCNQKGKPRSLCRAALGTQDDGTIQISRRAGPGTAATANSLFLSMGPDNRAFAFSCLGEPARLNIAAAKAFEGEQPEKRRQINTATAHRAHENSTAAAAEAPSRSGAGNRTNSPTNRADAVIMTV